MDHDNYMETMSEVDWRGHVGVVDRAPYTEGSVNGTVDEFKLIYRLLNSVGMY